MLKINDIVIDDYDIDVSIGNYDSTINGDKCSGTSPIISFSNELFMIKIETVYDVSKFSSLKEEDVSSFLSDITYEDEGGWISIIDYDYQCSFKSLGNNLFNVHLTCSSKYESDIKKIVIDDNFSLK